MFNSIGEIKATTERGAILRSAVESEEVNKIVEIGTLDGTGSTRVIIDSLLARASNANTIFLTIEANEQAFLLAQSNLVNAPSFVKILHGCLNDHDTPLLLMGLSPSESSWLSIDLSSRFNAPNVTGHLPASIDLAVLDGGEFTSFNDYLKIRSRARYIFLDDCNVRKNRLTYKTALEDGFHTKRYTPEGYGAVLLARAPAYIPH